MSFSFEFGFEERAPISDHPAGAVLFQGPGNPSELGHADGPLAVADASRFVEMYEMELDASPFQTHITAEVIGETDPVRDLERRARKVASQGAVPIIVGRDRAVSQGICGDHLVALWGTLGDQSWASAIWRTETPS